MGRAPVACRCTTPLPEAIVSEGGATLGHLCRRCLKTLATGCRVCKRAFRDLRTHLRRSECGRFDREGMFWSRERPPTARYRETQP